jgi:hypothetical protein
MGCENCIYLENANSDDEHVREEVEADFSFLSYLGKPLDVCAYSEERIPITFTDGGPSRLRALNLKFCNGQTGCKNYLEKNLETPLKIKSIDSIVS